MRGGTALHASTSCLTRSIDTLRCPSSTPVRLANRRAWRTNPSTMTVRADGLVGRAIVMSVVHTHGSGCNTHAILTSVVLRSRARVNWRAYGVAMAVRTTFDPILFRAVHQYWAFSSTPYAHSIGTKIRVNVGARRGRWGRKDRAPCQRDSTQPIRAAEWFVHWTQIRSRKTRKNIHIQSYLWCDSSTVIVGLTQTVVASDKSWGLATVWLGSNTSRCRRVATAVDRTPSSIQAEVRTINADIGSRA